MTAAADAPNLASAVNIGAFNLSYAIGAAVGGGVIPAGLGHPAVALAGAATSAIGLAAVLISRRRSARQSPQVESLADDRTGQAERHALLFAVIIV